MRVVAVTLAATFAIQLGYFLWKLAADSMPRIGEARPVEVVGRVLTSWKWMLGLGSTIIGWLLFVKATDMGEVSFVQPLMSVGDLFLVFMAVAFLHERLGALEWVGLMITIVGAALLSSEAKEVAAARIDWAGLGLICGASALACGGLVLFGARRTRGELPLAAAVGIAFGLGAVLTELMTGYIAQSGRSLESSAFVLNPILPFMVAANVLGLGLLQMAFQRGRAAVIIPVQLSFLNIVAVVAGMAVFSEAISMVRAASVLLILAGTALLHAGAQRTQ